MRLGELEKRQGISAIDICASRENARDTTLVRHERIRGAVQAHLFPFASGTFILIPDHFPVGTKSLQHHAKINKKEGKGSEPIFLGQG